MLQSNCSVFSRPPLFTVFSGQGLNGTISFNNGPNTLISFLAVARKLKIEFLPITWQEQRKPIGSGCTSQIQEALVSLETSFAFKRVADEHKYRVSESVIFQEFIGEITVLRHPAVSKHPNILELQGICWDVAPREYSNSSEHSVDYSPLNNKLWPVLVFEKSHFGDLNHFAKLESGRGLSLRARLQLCLEIGCAIRDMHFNRKDLAYLSDRSC